MDSKLVVDMLQGVASWPWTHYVNLFKVRELLSSQGFQIRHSIFFSISYSLPTSTPPNPALSITSMQFTDAKEGTHKGFPSLLFGELHIAHLTSSYGWTLIGKFSQGYNKTDPKLGRPSVEVEDLQKDFLTLDLRSSFSIGLLDNRHLLIKLHCEEDYLRVYSRTVWYIGAVTMRI